MSTNVRFVPLVLSAALLACTVTFPSLQRVTGSGNLITLTQDNADFDRVEITNAFEADIQQGASFSVVVRIDDNLEKYLQVTQAAGLLTIGLERDSGLTLNRVTLEVDITMPVLTAIEVSGAGNATVSGFESSQSFDMEASGASTIRGDIQTGDIRLSASGASTISLSGSGGALTLDVSGASQANLEEFETTDVDAVLGGASTAVVNPSGTLDVDASGASRLTYVGSPILGRMDLSGASSVDER
jgi:hypothetical protein